MRFRRRRRRWVLLGAIVLGIGGLLMAGRTRLQDTGVRIVLNVPENHLYVYERGERIARYRVSVGMEGYETPAGNYRITHAIWNPWWHPPNSEWARGRKVESPGPKNPMGRVKLHFSPMLYVHGTPEEHWLGRPASRGCVRMSNEDVIMLARFLHERSSPRIRAGRIDELLGGWNTQRIAFDRPVPFSVVYHVAQVSDGFLHIYPDVYRMVGGQFEDQVIEVLRTNGVALDEVDTSKLHRLIRKARKHKVSMSIDSLIAKPEGAPAHGGG